MKRDTTFSSSWWGFFVFLTETQVLFPFSSFSTTLTTVLQTRNILNSLTHLNRILSKRVGELQKVDCHPTASILNNLASTSTYKK